jgi:hypothetical protein
MAQLPLRHRHLSCAQLRPHLLQDVVHDALIGLVDPVRVPKQRKNVNVAHKSCSKNLWRQCTKPVRWPQGIRPTLQAATCDFFFLREPVQLHAQGYAREVAHTRAKGPETLCNGVGKSDAHQMAHGQFVLRQLVI